jgi:hypothetical protein
MKKILPLVLLGAGVLMAFNKPIMGLIAPASLELEISKPPIVMPSIYKVYSNEEALMGKYSLFKMVVKNTSNVAAKNVEVFYSVSNYIEQTLVQKIPLIQPGQIAVVNCYPSFPEKIVEKTTDSKETVKITVKGTNIKTKEESFSIPIKGRNEFMYNFMPADEIRTAGDYFENMPLLSCLVTPNDPIIKYLTQQIQEKVLKGEAASVNNKDEEGVRVLQGIYYATLQSHMVYSGTSGVPTELSDVSSIVQNIRLPREVITGKTGLCIELSLLYASIMACAGMDPVVYLVPGHAYPGFRMNGNYYAIESTAIGGEGLGGRSTPQQAFEAGMKNLKEAWPKFQSDDRYKVIDIREAIKSGAVAMELKDDNFLRQKIDEIARTFDPNNTQINAGNQTGNITNNTGGGSNDGGGGNNDGNNDGNAGGGNNQGGGNAGNGANIPSNYRMYQGAVSFAYPASWRSIGVPQGFPRQCRGVISNGAGTANVQIYSLPGGNRPDQIMQLINNHLGQQGYGLQYQQIGQNNGYTIYSGQTGSAQGVFLNWYGAFKVTGNGVDGVTIGASASTGQTHSKTLNNILNSVQ